MNKVFVIGYKALRKIGFWNFMNDKDYIQFSYRILAGKKLDLDDPKTFSDKIQWLKLNDRNPRYIKMVDKYTVKKYIAEVIGAEYVIKNLGVWDRFEDIDFDSLPDKFVLKCTHDSGGLAICRGKDSFDLDTARKKIKKSLKHNYYFRGREWPYKKVRPRIIAEELLEDSESNDIRDYKFYCFNGTPRFCQVISNRNTNETIDFFDMNWRHQEFTGLSLPNKPYSPSPIPIPIQFEKMKQFAEILSQNIPFLRVDFYEVNGKLFFGELTFYPASGFGVFYPQKWNLKLGEMIKLPCK